MQWRCLPDGIGLDYSISGRSACWGLYRDLIGEQGDRNGGLRIVMPLIAVFTWIS